jgi:carboxypeptidase C (cathepsin A)
MFYESRNDPVNDPIIMWFNGGPGCSSLLGAFQELGPYVVDDELSPTHQVNPYSWNNNASLLFMESPAGVGYSIANLSTDYPTNDYRQSEDAIKALLDWFSKFPEYKPNGFYISGESYGGIYVPWMAW